MGKIKRKLRLKFDLNIYSPVAIQRSVEAFADMAVFMTKRTKRAIEVQIQNISKDTKSANLADEFSNYVLGMTKKCL